MKLQIIKIFSFWAVISFLVHSAVENNPENPVANPPTLSNIQLTKPTVVKVKPAKKIKIGHYTSAKGKRLAMK